MLFFILYLTTVKISSNLNY